MKTHRQKPPWLVMLLFACLSASSPSTASAGQVMERIEQQGVIRIGFQEDVAPFASYDRSTRRHRGFSVDMAELLASYLSKRFGGQVRIEAVNLTASQRVDTIISGAIDIEMGASTQTFDREQSVDFSSVYFASETTFLVRRLSGISAISDLNGRRIAAGKGTTNLQLLRQLKSSGRLSPKEILSYDSHTLALSALIDGKADAYCADRVLLTTKRLQTPQPEQWLILEGSIGYEPYGFMIPENNSDLRDFVNNTIRWTILTGEYFDIYERWMGPLGIGPFKMPPSFKEYLNVITYPLPEDWWSM